MSLERKTVILFGAGAIASGYAPMFADEAQNVVIVSRGDSSERLVEGVKTRQCVNITGEVVAMHADASDFAELGMVYDEVVKRFGQVNVVVNGAGGNKSKYGNAAVTSLDAFVNLDPKISRDIMEQNYWSRRFSLQHFARILKAGGYDGSAVNITSMAGLQPLSKVGEYGAAFAAVENYTKFAAHLFAVTGIGRVNNVAVGFTIGDQNRKLLQNDDGTPTTRAKEILAGTSQGRFLDVKEIAPHVLYLADAERSGAINGHTLRVDGGFNQVSLAATAGYTSGK